MLVFLYGVDDLCCCFGNFVLEVLEKFRKNYDLIMLLLQEMKEKKKFCYCIWFVEKEECE